MSHGRKFWILGSFGLVTLIVGVTCWPLFTNPQLEPDDYRYLHHVQRLEGDFAGEFLEASIVENRWDHLWWLTATERVRFYRPTVVLSYWLDAKVYGSRLTLGLLLTNLLLHLVCAYLVSWILLQWIGPGLPALVGSALFASFFCHNEVIWYIAGRTDTLAALGFLSGLALHLAGRTRSVLRWMALPCYAFAFFSKELTIALPAVCLLNDWLIEMRGGGLKGLIRREWKLYACYVGLALIIQSIRWLALSGGDSSLVYPYFISPFHPEFPAHLLLKIRNYGENLLMGTRTKPFMQPDELHGSSSPAGLCLTITALALTLLLLRKERLFLVLCALGLLTWIPTCFVYSSARYLYLPSVAVATTLAIALARLRPIRNFFLIGLGVAAIWIGHQGFLLQRMNESMANPGAAQIIEAQLSGMSEPIPKGEKVLVLNLWGNWLQVQFMEDQLRVNLDDPELSLRVLTLMPISGDLGAGLEITAEGENVLLLEGGLKPDRSGRFSLLEPNKAEVFTWQPFQDGTRVEGERLGFIAEIVRSQGEKCFVLRFEFPEPLQNYTLLRFHPHPDQRMSPWMRMRQGNFARVKIP